MMSQARRRLLLTGASLSATGSWAQVATELACPEVRKLKANLNLIGNSLPVVQHLAAQAQLCAGAGFKVDFKVTPQARVETDRAFATPGKCPFDAAVVSSGVFNDLYSRGQLLSVSDLVDRLRERYQIEDRMLVRMDGEVMAIAFMQNTQNLVYRSDLFEKHQLPVPKNYREMTLAAKVLRARERDLAYPIAQGFSKGWDVATEFTNVFSSLGGRFFETGTAMPMFQGRIGVEAVRAMQSLMPFMSPNALSSNTDDVMNQLQQGRAAMGVLWASRASRMDDPSASRVVGKMVFAAAPAVEPGGLPAAHLWWDGVVFPKTLKSNPVRREAAFRLVMETLDAQSVRKGNDLAIWVRSSYQPGRFGTGVQMAMDAGAHAWPGEPFFSLAHAEIGKVLPDALKGQRSIESALEGASHAYLLAAQEKGFLAKNL